VAVGLLPESQAAELLEHFHSLATAAACYAFKKLRTSRDEATEQEITLLSALPSVQEEWQQSTCSKAQRERIRAPQERPMEPGLGRLVPVATSKCISQCMGICGGGAHARCCDALGWCRRDASLR